MVDDGKAGSARRDRLPLASLYREMARAAADFASRHGERTLIDTVQGFDAIGCVDPALVPSRDVLRQR